MLQVLIRTKSLHFKNKNTKMVPQLDIHRRMLGTEIVPFGRLKTIVNEITITTLETPCCPPRPERPGETQIDNRN